MFRPSESECGHAWQGGVCMAGGHVAGGSAWGHACMAGGCVSPGGMCGRRYGH